jgi:hypothetical protein
VHSATKASACGTVTVRIVAPTRSAVAHPAAGSQRLDTAAVAPVTSAGSRLVAV